MSDRDAAERLRGILGELHQVLESVEDLDDSSREALRGTQAHRTSRYLPPRPAATGTSAT